MLKVPEHQVAGHRAINGVLGPLIDDSGKFYKPIPNDTRGSTELSFYTSLSSNPNIPLSFFPSFHGTCVVDASDGSGPHPHLILQNLLSGYSKPSVIDIKIGARTWHLADSEDYINKCFKKDKETSTVRLGFRISGVKDSITCWEPTRKFLQTLSAEGVTLVLKKFVSTNSADVDGADPDCGFAAKVYGEVLNRLVEIKEWFEDQTVYHFYSCSVLVAYEKDNGKGKGNVVVKLVDFAHVVDANGAIDHNFLGGLCSFIKFLKDIIAPLQP